MIHREHSSYYCVFNGVCILSRCLAIGLRVTVTSKKVMVWSEYHKSPGSENGSLNDIIGMIATDHLDVGIGKFAMTSSRISLVSYLSVTFPTNVCYVNYGFFPQDLDVYKETKDEFQLETHISTILPRILVLSFCLNYSTGHDTTPQFWSCRLLYLTSYLTYVILFTAYSAVFISILAVHQFAMPFLDFQGLLDIGTYRFGVVRLPVYLDIFDECNMSIRGNAMHLFQQATDPALTQVYRKLIVSNINDLPKSTKEGFQRICDDSNYAFAIDELSAINNRLTCEVIAVPYAFLRIPTSMIINKRSPYRKLFSH
ncbi:hypothetical protein B7P43_G06976 [Cryptotermes secundus]|uniref:Ionotropic glutamate receptor C-terminal domain-containing protein n=1 Tax=Cryptotermes secundus TaxID=105785 RepID=A0A2J7R509_9NEOP|nr:hypothetical protein B7P43_G06976 [Cryptotermes secundus]